MFFLFGTGAPRLYVSEKQDVPVCLPFPRSYLPEAQRPRQAGASGLDGVLPGQIGQLTAESRMKLMKKTRLSLPFKVNLLMIVIILVTSALLLAVSNMYYWETVYNPHIRKLNQISYKTEDLLPAARGILRFIDSEKMDEILRAEETGDDLLVISRMNEMPSLTEIAGQERSLFSDVMDFVIAFMPDWEHAELDEVYVEARKGKTVYHVLQNVITDKRSEPMVLFFGQEGTRFPGLQPETAETPALFRDGRGARLARCIPIRAEEGDMLIWLVYDMDEFLHNHHRFLNQSILTILMMAVLASIAGMFLLRRLVTRRVLNLAKAAGDFRPGADGQYSKENVCQAEAGTPDEIGKLGNEIRTMQEQIIENTESLARMTAEKERISTELNLAKQIQAAALPRNFPDRAEFELYAFMKPAREVGGDFYDFFLVDEDHLAMVIADVSGKGVPAALFMMVAKSLIKNQLMTGCDPAQAMESANRQLCEGNDSKMFVTAWAAVLELSTGRGYVCNAGHEKPGLRRAGGMFALLDYRHNLMVGAIPKAKYQSHAFELSPGDCLFVYTDGVTEAHDEDEGMFGEKRLEKTLNEHAEANPEEMIRRVQDELERFTGGALQFDDITMMCLKYLGAGRKPNETEGSSGRQSAK